MRNRLPSAVLAVLATMSPLVVSRAQTPPALSAPTPALVATEHRPVVPLPPADLLALLPKTVDEWQLKQSHANNFIMDWVFSQAQREFSYTPPPSTTAQPGDPPPPPMTLRFTITDTGYYANLMADLGPAATNKGGAETLTLNGFPARRMSVGQTGARLRLLVKNRYVVQIDVQNQPTDSVQRWLGLLDPAKLAALPIEGEETLQRPFPITRIDELEPRNSSVSMATWATQAELDARMRKRH